MAYPQLVEGPIYEWIGRVANPMETSRSEQGTVGRNGISTGQVF